MPFATSSIANSNTTVLTVSQGQRWRVETLVLCNYGASAETLTVYVVPSGSAAGNSNTIVKSLSLASAETWVFGEPLCLSSGDSIIAIGSTGSLATAQAHYEVQV
jgi:hypothetical protein